MGLRAGASAEDGDRVCLTPAILPPYARRSKSLEVLIPILYLKGISTGHFEGKRCTAHTLTVSA